MTPFRKISFLLCAAFFLLAYAPVSSGQDIKHVEGKVVNAVDGKPVRDVQIFPYNTIADAKDAKRKIEKLQEEKSEEFFDPGTYVSYSDVDGNFETNVASTGAILFYLELSAPVIVIMNGNLQITVKMAVGQQIDKAVIIADLESTLPEIDVPEGNEEMFTAGAVFPLPARLGKSDARLVLQTYVLEAGSNDTVKFNDPIVMDGKDYHETQLRRMGFDGNNDPLFKFAQERRPFNDSTRYIRCRDTVKILDPNICYLYRARLWAEDYNREYYTVNDTTLGRSDRLAKPMRFLQYDFKQYQLDPEKFRKKPQRERHGTSGKVNLKFLVNEAAIDPNDAVSLSELDKMREQLRNAISDEGATLKEFHIKGFASPDGMYAKNLDLANRRMKYVSEQIMSVIPKYTYDRTYKTSHADVATWSAVADLLEADNKTEEAAKIRGIVANYSNPGSAASMDAQFSKMRSLPFYKTEISPRLQSLRSVDYTSVIEIYRELTAEEIYDKYRSDPDYRSGKKTIALYEYWHLFNMVKDPDELETLYRMACEASNHTWELPANNLASALIGKNISDTTILAPFIDWRYSINQTLWNNGRIDRAYNNEVIVANQVVMFLIAKKYLRAAQYAEKLPNNKYHDLKQVTKCLAGFWKTDAALREDVRNTSPVNRVVIDLAEDRLARAEEELEDLPKDTPLYHYLKAQILCRKHNGFFDMSMTDDILAVFTDQDYAASALCKAIKMDSSYIDVAKSDYYIYEELLALANKFLKEGDPTKEL